ncbi:cell wall-active antibiotics response protein [Candidatus Bipolaricaulota bacterium]|nr:cell wall-active antibiotics response protein [Candidatus Bipolaricaulota bacterium]
MNQKRWIGGILIGIGVSIILGNVGVLENFWELFATYWPGLLILAGGFNVVTNPAGKVGGFIVATAGLLLLLNNMDRVQIFTQISFWPVLLILAGIWFLFRGGKEPTVVDKDSLNLVALFSGNSSKVVSQAFRGGSSVSMFGGSEVDLTDAKLSSGEAKFDVFAMFGGTEITVPESWEIVIKGLPLFGGLDDKTSAPTREGEVDPPTLVINYLALFGGVEVKN